MLLLLHLFRLSEDLSDGPNGDSVFHALLDHCLASPLIALRFLILVPLHGVRLAGPSLSICKYGSMKALHDLVDQPTDLELLEDLRLAILLVDDLVEAKCLLLDLALVSIRRVLVDATCFSERLVLTLSDSARY